MNYVKFIMCRVCSGSWTQLRFSQGWLLRSTRIGQYMKYYLQVKCICEGRLNVHSTCTVDLTASRRGSWLLTVTSFASLLSKVDLAVSWLGQVNFPLLSLHVLLEAAPTFPRQRRHLYGETSLCCPPVTSNLFWTARMSHNRGLANSGQRDLLASLVKVLAHSVGFLLLL